MLKVNDYYDLKPEDRIAIITKNRSYQKNLDNLYYYTPLEESQNYGFKLEDILLDCTFNYYRCNERFVLMFTSGIGGSRGARPPPTGPDSFVLTCKIFET